MLLPGICAAVYWANKHNLELLARLIDHVRSVRFRCPGQRPASCVKSLHPVTSMVSYGSCGLRTHCTISWHGVLHLNICEVKLIQVLCIGLHKKSNINHYQIFSWCIQYKQRLTSCTAQYLASRSQPQELVRCQCRRSLWDSMRVACRPTTALKHQTQLR